MPPAKYREASIRPYDIIQSENPGNWVPINISDFIGDDDVTGIVLDNESYKRKINESSII